MLLKTHVFRHFLIPSGVDRGANRCAGRRDFSTSTSAWKRVTAAVDFEVFRPELTRALAYSDGSQGGRPPFDPVMMLKTLVIQPANTLSDERTEFLINDRLSFMRIPPARDTHERQAVVDPSSERVLAGWITRVLSHHRSNGGRPPCEPSDGPSARAGKPRNRPPAHRFQALVDVEKSRLPAHPIRLRIHCPRGIRK